MIRNTAWGDRLFDVFNYLFMACFCFSAVYPFLYLLALSFEHPDSSLLVVRLWPKQFYLGSYREVFKSDMIAYGFMNSIFRTVVGSALSLIVSCGLAYPLSKRYLPNRTFWMGFIVFTMFFSGGLVPTYLLVKNLGLLDSLWSMILPGLVPTFTMIIIRNYFMTLPDSIEDSAKIDGANDITILFRIVIPMSMSIIATAILWIAVGHWNAWFDCLIYINTTRKQVLQLMLRRLVIEGSQEMVQLDSQTDDLMQSNPETIKSATIMIVTLPIIILYPFLQKYFVKGIVVGSLKG
jgi:putative aldouronate transport system permease protein